jgi:hypothetical protein
VLAALPSMRSNAIVAMLVQLVLYPPPMIVAFLAGMLAPRGAWLVGGISSAVAGLAYVAVYASSLFGGDTDAATILGWTRTLGQDEKTSLLGSAILFALGFGLVFGIAIGAFAGFYRRFLALSGPQRAPAKPSPSRAAPRRR